MPVGDAYIILIRNLEGTFPHDLPYYSSKKEAYERLKEITGEDFGYDGKAWRDWYKKFRQELRESSNELDYDFEAWREWFNSNEKNNR